MKQMTMALALLLMYPGSSKSAQLVINEVMINEPGSSTNLEWVELFNRGTESCDISDYLFVEGGDTTGFESLPLAAGGFVIVARKGADAGGGTSFESYWGDNSGVWGDTPDESFPVIEVRMSLRNSDDVIELINSSAGTVERVQWYSSPPDGVSWERKNPHIDTTEGNFGNCSSEHGSTPGRANSILAPPRDLGIEIDSLRTNLIGSEVGRIELFATVRNSGLNPAADDALLVVLDRDLSHDVSLPDSAWYEVIPGINPGENSQLQIVITASVGRTAIILQLPDDDLAENNRYDTTLAVGDSFTELLISELQLSSDAENGREWIELKNEVEYSLDISGFRIGAPGLEMRIADTLMVAPGHLALICQDTSALRIFKPEIECALVQLSPWIGLDDGGGSLRLISDLGTLSDSLTFAGSQEFGASWERDSDTCGGSFAELFYRSSDPFGSTPCRENSERILPPAFDLAVDPDSILREYRNDEMDLLTLGLMISNVGAQGALGIVVDIYEDTDFDGVAQPEDLLLQIPIEFLASGDHLRLEEDFALRPGCHRLIWMLPADEVLENNVAVVECSFGPVSNEVLITEYLANPEGGASCEWVELQNVSSRPINLKSWNFGDAVRFYAIEDEIVLAAGDYLILAEAPDDFSDGALGGCTPVALSGWSPLNNSGDLIILRDRYGVVADSFSYSLTASGNRSIELNQDAFGGGERIWYPSTSESGSSPCKRNSVTGAEDAPILVSLPRPVFSPGSGDELLVEISCPPATRLTMEIFDLAGRRHYTLADARLFSVSSLHYAGHSDLVGQLNAGAYLLLISGGDDNAYTDKIGFAVAPPR